jgi:hypothetical protein
MGHARAARPRADGITCEAVHSGPGKAPQSWTGDCRADSDATRQTRQHATSADLLWAYAVASDPVVDRGGEFGCACEVIAEHSLIGGA